jgi:hypothetical protein
MALPRRALFALALLLLLLAPREGARASDRGLCFVLPDAASSSSSSSSSRVRPRPNARVDADALAATATRCVTHPRWDLQAAHARLRVVDARDADATRVALRCERAFTSFLCDRALAPRSANDRDDDDDDDAFPAFSCEAIDPAVAVAEEDEEEETAGSGANDASMETCVWPVCETLCVGSPSASRAKTTRDAKSFASTCARCARACDVTRTGATIGILTEPTTPGDRYCAALARQRARGGARSAAPRREARSGVAPDFGGGDDGGEVRSIHWSPYDRVRVVNADP